MPTKYQIIDSAYPKESVPADSNFEYVYEKAAYYETVFFVRSKRYKNSKFVTSKSYAFDINSKRWVSSWKGLLGLY